MEKTAFIQSYCSGIHLLYVEDDERIASQVTLFLTRFFRRIDRATDGAEGLKMYRASPYGLIISDIMMPSMMNRVPYEVIGNAESDIVEKNL